MAIDYRIEDNLIFRDPAEFEAWLNAIGAEGWTITESYILAAIHTRRSVFVASAPAEYHVLDYPTGYTPAEVENLFDQLGADGWQLFQLDLIRQTQRRAIFMRGGSSGGSGGGIAEAPQDNVTYGRFNATWNPALALNNDTLDGGNF